MTKDRLVETLAKLLGEANKRNATPTDVFGSCAYTDVNGNSVCSDNFSQFQCQQVSGNWTPGGSCP